MKRLEGFQRKYLRGIAHGLKPVVFVGQKGLSSEVILAAGLALESHELIKIKFNDFKEKDQKAELSELLEKETGSEVVGIIGHTVIFYRQHNDPEKRRIFPPQRKAASGRTGKGP
jgi:RNA-binding protein